MHSHRDLCKIVAKWLLKKPEYDIVCWELKWGRGFVDAIGITSHPRRKNPRITVVEVKRTRSDLLQDLKKKKMLKYQTKSTHCYLAATREALGITSASQKHKALEDLVAKGLPRGWGVILLPSSGKAEPQILRRATKFRDASRSFLNDATRKIARSMVHRVLLDTSPMRERHAY